MSDAPPTFAYAPMTPDQQRDASHLTILAICHYVLAGLTALVGCCGSIYVGLGIAMASGAIPQQNGAGGAAVAGIFMSVFGAVFIVLMLGFAAALIFSGRCMQRRKRRLFSIVTAALLCTNFPFGTILGVLTIVVLCRASVIEAYNAGA
jgi:hypothetical protein